MNENELKRYFPQASRSTLRANQAGGSPSSAKPKQVVCHDALATQQGTQGNPGRIRLSISSYRRRLLDPDNLQGGCKYFVDCCRYAKLIPDDRPEDITLEVRQFKVKTKAEERTEIELL